MRKCVLLAVAIIGASLLWGSSAKAQCVQLVPTSNNVIVSNGIQFAPVASFQSFGAFNAIVPTNGIFLNQGLVGVGGNNVIVAGRGLGRGRGNVVVANGVGAGAGRQTIIQRNGLFGSRTTVINR